MDDPRTEILSSLNTNRLTIKGFTPFVFLCGGPIGNDTKFPLSLRDSLYHHLMVKDSKLFSRIRTAEEITDWFRNGIYSDLISFERHLAGLSALIVLIVESPGAIAELGSFSQVREIAERLHVIIQEKHYDAESYIKLGPIDFLEVNYPDKVHVYPWDDKSNNNNFNIDIDDVRKDIDSSLKSLPNEQKLSLDIDGHRMLFICDLLGILESHYD